MLDQKSFKRWGGGGFYVRSSVKDEFCILVEVITLSEKVLFTRSLISLGNSPAPGE